MNREIVVARYKEDVSWLLSVAGFACTILDKSDDIHEPWNGRLRNVGRESNTYLHWIVNALTGSSPMPDEVVFCQGRPFDHDPKFMVHLADDSVRHYGDIYICTPDGGPHMGDAFLHEYCRVFGLPILPQYKFVAGAQFRLSAEQIKARPLEFYEGLLAITKLQPRAPYSLERLWGVIFGLRL